VDKPQRFVTLDLNGIIDTKIRSPALKKVMTGGGMDLDIIVNPKVTDDGRSIIQVRSIHNAARKLSQACMTNQLETAAGAAIKHFKNAHIINVPRSRFLPVMSCSDLLLIKSDIYSLKDGQLIMNDNRMFGTIPVIKLGDHFKRVNISISIEG
jgi:UTP--glucose-1-phosphate uridylyltransferase